MNLMPAQSWFCLRVFFVFLIPVLLVAGCKNAANNNAQLKYEPDVVKIIGTIRNETFPGPPNYEDISKGDEPEDYWILKLRAPIDVAKDPNYPDGNRAEKNVRNVQLVFCEEKSYADYRKYLDKTVVVTGTLFHQVTVYHKTTLLIDVKDIQKVE